MANDLSIFTSFRVEHNQSTVSNELSGFITGKFPYLLKHTGQHSPFLLNWNAHDRTGQDMGSHDAAPSLLHIHMEQFSPNQDWPGVYTVAPMVQLLSTRGSSENIKFKDSMRSYCSIWYDLNLTRLTWCVRNVTCRTVSFLWRELWKFITFKGKDCARSHNFAPLSSLDHGSEYKYCSKPRLTWCSHECMKKSRRKKSQRKKVTVFGWKKSKEKKSQKRYFSSDFLSHHPSHGVLTDHLVTTKGAYGINRITKSKTKKESTIPSLLCIHKQSLVQTKINNEISVTGIWVIFLVRKSAVSLIIWHSRSYIKTCRSKGE